MKITASNITTKGKVQYIPKYAAINLNFNGTPLVGLNPLTVQFSAHTTGPITEWIWDFGDGNPPISTSANPVYIFTSAGFYDISITVSGPPGTDTTAKSSYVHVEELPLVNFAGNPVSGFGPLIVQFSALTSGPVSEWIWNFGDGGGPIDTSANPIKTFTSAGTYNISLTVSGSVGSNSTAKSSYINVLEPVNSNFIGSPLSGLTPLTVQFSALTTGPITEWVWNFGDGAGPINTTANPIRIFTSVGNYTISLTVSGGGVSNTSSKVSYIQVNPGAPIANFIGSPTIGIGSTSVTFTNTTSGGPYTESRWDFQNDGITDSTLTNPSFTFGPGIYSVKLTVSGPGGNDSIIKSNYINIASADTSGNWLTWNGSQVLPEVVIVSSEIVNNSAAGLGGLRSIGMNNDMIVFNNVGGNTLKAYSLRVTGNTVTLLQNTTLATDVRERLYMPMHSLVTSAIFYVGYNTNNPGGGINARITSYLYNSDGTISTNFSTLLSSIGTGTGIPAAFGFGVNSNDTQFFGYANVASPSISQKPCFGGNLSAAGLGTLRVNAGASQVYIDSQGRYKSLHGGSLNNIQGDHVNRITVDTIAQMSALTGLMPAGVSGVSTTLQSIAAGRINDGRVALFYGTNDNRMAYSLFIPTLPIVSMSNRAQSIITSETINPGQIGTIDTCYVGDRCWFIVYGNRSGPNQKLRGAVVQLDAANSAVGVTTEFFDIASGTHFKYVTCQTIGNIRNKVLITYTKGTGSTLSLYGRLIRIN